MAGLESGVQSLDGERPHHSLDGESDRIVDVSYFAAGLYYYNKKKTTCTITRRRTAASRPIPPCPWKGGSGCDPVSVSMSTCDACGWTCNVCHVAMALKLGARVLPGL